VTADFIFIGTADAVSCSHTHDAHLQSSRSQEDEARPDLVPVLSFLYFQLADTVQTLCVHGSEAGRHMLSDDDSRHLGRKLPHHFQDSLGPSCRSADGDQIDAGAYTRHKAGSEMRGGSDGSGCRGSILLRKADTGVFADGQFGHQISEECIPLAFLRFADKINGPGRQGIEHPHVQGRYQDHWHGMGGKDLF
jgi:hypothetical protein